MVTVEEGVPIAAFKGAQESRAVYRTARHPEDSHLDPLFVLLPNPVPDLPDDVRRRKFIKLSTSIGSRYDL